MFLSDTTYLLLVLYILRQFKISAGDVQSANTVSVFRTMPKGRLVDYFQFKAFLN